MAPLTQYLTAPPPDSLEGMTVDVTSTCEMSTMSTLEDPSVYSSSTDNGNQNNVSISKKHRPSSFTIPENNDSTSTTEEDDDDSDERRRPLLRRKSSRGNFPNVLKLIAIQRQVSVRNSKKNVHFAAEIFQVLTIESHKDFSSRERSRCWWTSSEKDKCMAKHERIVSRMEHRKPCRKNQTFRGLESWTAAGAANLDRVINECVDAVMDEQDNQWKMQKDDFERIAFVSQQVTNDSAQRARQVGLLDEREAIKARTESWAEDDDGATVGSGMGRSVASAVRRRKKMDHLRDRRDPTLNKKRRGSKTEKNSEGQHHHQKPPTPPVKDSQHKPQSPSKELKTSSHSHRSHKSDDKLRRSSHSHSSERSSRHRSSSSSDKKSSSRSSSVSSSKRDKDSRSISSSRHSRSRDRARPSSSSSVSSSSKKKSSSSRSNESSKSSSRRSTKQSTPSDSKPPLHTPPTSVSSSASDSLSVAAATKTSSRSAKFSDPPGRHITRCDSSHADSNKLESQ